MSPNDAPPPTFQEQAVDLLEACRLAGRDVLDREIVRLEALLGVLRLIRREAPYVGAKGAILPTHVDRIETALAAASADGLTVQEIAGATGISRGCVSAVLYRTHPERFESAPAEGAGRALRWRLKQEAPK